MTTRAGRSTRSDEGPALLQHRDNLVGGTLVRRRHRRDGLVPVRVELLPDRIDFGQRVLLEGRAQLAQRQLDALAQLLGGGILDLERLLEAVHHGDQDSAKDSTANL